MANFTPEEISEILAQFFDVTGKRQYVGARYVPIFGRKDETSIAWDNSKPYEPLTIVLYQGNSYTSRTYVPTGVDISDEQYWANTGNYNAQVEAYRQEVTELRNEWGVWKVQTVEDFTRAIDNIPGILPSSAFDTTDTVAKTILDNTHPTEINAVIYSDSTFVENTNVPNEGYTGVLGTMVADVTGMTITNRGVGGETIQGLLTRLNNSAAGDFTGFDIVFLAYCTNNWQGSTPIWWNDGNTNSFEYYLNQVFDRLQVLAPLARIVFITPAYGHRMYNGTDNYNANTTEVNYNVRGFTLESYVDMAMKVCHERNVRALDLFHIMNVNENNYQYYMVRSSYDSTHAYYDIWVHYSKLMKELIAQLFLDAYPYAVPAFPYEHGNESFVTTNNYTLSAAVEVTNPVPFVNGDIEFNSRYGTGVAANTQHVAVAFFTGNDTLMCQVSKPMYLQITKVGNAGVYKRYYIVNNIGLTCINVRGMHGKCAIFAVERNNEGVNDKQGVIYNLRVFQGKVAFHYSKEIPAVMSKYPAALISHLDVSTDPTKNVYMQETDSAYEILINYVALTEDVSEGTVLVTISCAAFGHDQTSPFLVPCMIYTTPTGGGSKVWQPKSLGLKRASQNLANVNIVTTGALSNGDIICAQIRIPKMYTLMQPRSQA